MAPRLRSESARAAHLSWRRDMNRIAVAALAVVASSVAWACGSDGKSAWSNGPGGTGRQGAADGGGGTADEAGIPFGLLDGSNGKQSPDASSMQSECPPN